MMSTVHAGNRLKYCSSDVCPHGDAFHLTTYARRLNRYGDTGPGYCVDCADRLGIR